MNTVNIFNKTNNNLFSLNHSKSNPRKKTLKKSRILCIDDSETTQFLVKNSLMTAGYEVIGNTDPLKSLMFLLEGKNPDLIISDIQMPNLEGYKLLELLKKSSKLKNIPVIMLTSQKSESAQLKAEKLGAIAYITKPFSCNYLIKKVNGIMEIQ